MTPGWWERSGDCTSEKKKNNQISLSLNLLQHPEPQSSVLCGKHQIRWCFGIPCSFFFFLQMFSNCSYPYSVSFNPVQFHYSLHGRFPTLPQLPSVNGFLSSPSICPSNDSSKPQSLGDKCSLQIKPGEEYNLITK